jgi:dihydroorotase
MRELKDGDYLMNPPLREKDDVEAVIAGLENGTIDCIATDHAPHSPAEKSDFYTAPCGVMGLETSVAAAFKYLPKSIDIAEKMCINPRRILGLKPVNLGAGSSGDIMVIAKENWTVDIKNGRSKSENYCFKGVTFSERVKHVFYKGVKIF